MQPSLEEPVPVPPPVAVAPQPARKAAAKAPKSAEPAPTNAVAAAPTKAVAVAPTKAVAPAPTKAVAPPPTKAVAPSVHLPAATGWTVPTNWAALGAPTAKPSDHDPLEMYVPPEIEAMAQTVMAMYDMSVSGIQVITTKPDKGGAIWRIETNKGPRSLKLLHRESARSLFSVGAQAYLVSQGARVPALVPSLTGENYVLVEGRLWIVTDWVEPLVPASKVDLAGAQALCYGLGEFHRLSQGYVPPAGAKLATRLRRWPKTYQKCLNKIGWFRQIARAYPEMPASTTLLSMVDLFEQQAKDAITRLQASGYGELIARGDPAWGIVHQDYGFSNGQIGTGGVWIIDLDGVAHDLPIRDLRKLITSTMDDFGTWDLTWIRGMIDAYQQANPIEPALYEVLLIDMSLPNEFYKHVAEIVFEPTLTLTTELDTLLKRLIETDKSKWMALAELGLPPAKG
jgi:CotS family spore coat protein